MDTSKPQERQDSSSTEIRLQVEKLDLHPGDVVLIQCGREDVDGARELANALTQLYRHVGFAISYSSMQIKHLPKEKNIMGLVWSAFVMSSLSFIGVFLCLVL